MIAKLRDNPELKALIRRACRSYRKHDVIVLAYSSVNCHGGAWSGGSRSWYEHIDLSTGATRPISIPTASPQFGGGPDPVIELEPGHGVISGGTFCGKTATLTLYAHADDIEALGVDFYDKPTQYAQKA